MKKCLILVVIIWLALITWFSNQPLKESTAQTYAVLTKLNLADHHALVQAKTADIRFLKFAARKAAHFGLYFGLGTLLSLMTYFVFRMGRSSFCIYAWLGGTVWGAIDELHQFFVPGRSMQFRDVLIDSSGVLCAVLLMYIVFGVYERLKAQKREERRILQMDYLID